MKVQPITRPELLLAQAALYAAITLQLMVWVINTDLTYGPHQVIIVIELLLSAIIGVSAHKRHLWPSHIYRLLSFLLLGLLSLANISSFVLVARLLISNAPHLSGKELLVAALAIFITNIIVFALWYWELDRPGLSGSKWSKHDKDFQFTQQDLKPDFLLWQPHFADYLYLSVTNAVNFAPADTRPVTIQAKFLMGIQALISVFTLALILARSVSILN